MRPAEGAQAQSCSLDFDADFRKGLTQYVGCSTLTTLHRKKRSGAQGPLDAFRQILRPATGHQLPAWALHGHGQHQALDRVHCPLSSGPPLHVLPPRCSLSSFMGLATPGRFIPTQCPPRPSSRPWSSPHSA
jgi:hypothetical protein